MYKRIAASWAVLAIFCAFSAPAAVTVTLEEFRTSVQATAFVELGSQQDFQEHYAGGPGIPNPSSSSVAYAQTQVWDPYSSSWVPASAQSSSFAALNLANGPTSVHWTSVVSGGVFANPGPLSWRTDMGGMNTIHGTLTVGVSDGIPAGTPVTLRVSGLLQGSLQKMWDLRISNPSLSIWLHADQSNPVAEVAVAAGSVLDLSFEHNEWDLFQVRTLDSSIAVDVTVTPEPATLSLLALGACLPLLRNRR